MAVGLTSARYVRALFSVADRRGERDRLRDELAALGKLFDASPPLVAALRDPRLPAAAKQRLLMQVGVETASDTLRDYVALCLERGRAQVVLETPEEFLRLEREASGVVEARVETARALNDDVRTSIQAKLEEVTGKTVQITEEVRPELIGGVRILIGSKMYDGSVKRQLDELATHLQSTRIG